MFLFVKIYSLGIEVTRSFIHVCLLIALFSILVFGCLESDDRSCRRLRHCSLINSSIK